MIGYLSQHAEELGREGTVLEAAQRATGLTPNKARALLGRFLFSGEEAEKPLEGLSGGERRRLSLAVLVQSGANFLIIDEPTNHLDLESREALEDALRAFDGTLLLVSHDRALLDAVGTRTIAIEEKRLASYLGGWADYLRVREERKEQAKPPKAAKEKRNGEAEARRRLEGQAEAGSARSSARSRRPSSRCACSRTSWATRRRGPPPPRPSARRSATRRRSGRSRSSTSSSGALEPS